MSRTGTGRNIQLKEWFMHSRAQEFDVSGLVLRDPEWAHVTTHMTSVVLVGRCGEKEWERTLNDAVEDFHSRGVSFQLSQC